jgi:sporulation protein YlmC with PRC-barrel domain
MILRKILLATAACAALASPALSQATAPSPTPPASPVTPPASTVPTMSVPGPVADLFYQGSWMPTHWRTSDAIGMAVYNKTNEKLGDVEDLLIDGDGRVLAAVIGVGGFLGMGEHKVAVTYRAFQMLRDAAGKGKLVVDVDKTTLKNAPQYKPTDAIKRS